MNIFDLPDGIIDKEQLVQLVDNNTVRIEKIISTGQTSDWYDQEQDEFVMLIDGFATISYEDNTQVHLKKGDTLYIPAHKIHRVSYTSNEPACIWLCVFWKTCHE